LHDVPIISTFFGILVRMYFDDHAPPHFHAEHHGQHALVAFDGRIIEGEIGSGTARKLIREWARLHRLELEANWKRAKSCNLWRALLRWSRDGKTTG
jgi:hypothetical protein